MSFQRNAFQRNAFQLGNIAGSTPIVTAPPEQISYPGGRKKTKYYPNYAESELLRKRVETFPKQVQEAINLAVVVDVEAERKEIFAKQLQGIEFSFQRLYTEIFNQYYQSLIDLELVQQLKEAQKRREEEEMMVLLLLM
jgi:hypothetical protein